MFYDFLFDKLYYPDVKPCLGHIILSEWEKNGKFIDIITQNMDGLHQLSGSRNVVEFHGSIHSATCFNPKCQRKYTIREVYERRKTKKDFYICDCGHSSTKRYIKPDVVLFDEASKWMSARNMYNIRRRMWLADIILVLGSSLNVYPFASFIENKPLTKPLVIINKDYVRQEKMKNTFTIHENISDSLFKINEYL